jgi:hypothetical protein
MREGINTHRTVVAKSEGKRLLWNPRSTWEDNIKTDIKGVELLEVDCIKLN